MDVTPDQMFIAGLGVSYRSEGDLVVGRLEVSDEVCVPGRDEVRAGVLATVADVVAGWGANRLAFPRIPLTVDLTVRRLAPVGRGDLDVVAQILKAGRTTLVAEARFSVAGSSAPVALSHATFALSPRPDDVFDVQMPARMAGRPALAAPILDDLGVRLLGSGVAELARRPYVMQPAGTIQGGAVALLAEAAAESSLGTPVGDLEVRYLTTIRVGPARAAASVLAPGLARVEIRDPGNGDRLTTVALARSAVA